MAAPSSTSALWVLAAAGLVAGAHALVACGLVTPFQAPPPADGGDDADGDGDADADHEVDAAGDADGDGGRDADGFVPLTGPGPLAFVATRGELLHERRFDIDGNGSLDNAIGDLGADTAEIFAGILSSLMMTTSSNLGRRMVLFPWVEDRGALEDREMTMIVVIALDEDDPPDPADDLSGHERFYVSHSSLDACGEPRQAFVDGQLAGGTFSGRADAAELPYAPTDDVLPVRRVQAAGTISPGGAGFELLLAGALAFGDLGRLTGLREADGLNLLEVLLAGGAAVGVPTVPGVSPDLDLDGDGLEGFVVDEGLRITQCIDGDRTVIDGRDCWADPRMQDAFSLTARFEHVPAGFAGREPGWEALVDGTCDDPPERSLFDGE